MSSYIRAIKPLLRYMGRRYRGFLSMRSRMGPNKKRKFGALGRSGSVKSSVEPDGVKTMKSNYGRIRKSSNRRAIGLRKALNPVLTHINTGEFTTLQDSSGTCKWVLIPVAQPSDINDIISKAGSLLQGSWAASWGVQQGYSGKFAVYSHNTGLSLKNQTAVNIRAQIYDCVARENICATAEQGTIQEIFNEGWAKTSYNAAGNMSATDIDSTLYMNPLWCHFFKITRARTVDLQAGMSLQYNMAHGYPKQINTLELGTDPKFLALRGFTRCIVIKYTGGLVSTINDANGDGVDTSSFKVIQRFVRKYRWNLIPFQGDMITQTDGDAADGASYANQSNLNMANGGVGTGANNVGVA